MSRFVVVAVAAVLAVPAVGGVKAQAPSRTVFVSVNTGEGAQVTDLASADFSIKDGGKTCAIVKVEQATTPMQIAVLVDDNGTGFFRAGLAAFINKVQNRAEYSISSVTGQTQKITDFTNNMDTLSAALGRLNARPSTNEGGQLLEGIYEYARELEKREAQRSIILVLTVGGNEQSTRDSKQALDQLQKSGAALSVVEVTGNTLRPQGQASSPAELLEGNMNLSAVLGDGPKQSGGRRVAIVATAAGLIGGLQKIGDDLLRQYAVTYTLPDGAKPSGRLEVKVGRKGTTLYAPTRIPQR